MKKLMIAAAAAAMIGGAYADVPAPTPCITGTDGCQPAVFKLTANGKVSMNMGDYKTVQTLKISKGLIVAKMATEEGQETVTKYGWNLSLPASFFTYETADIPVALTNGLTDVSTERTEPVFTLEKLTEKFTDLDALKKAYAGATADVLVNVYTGGTIRVRTGSVKCTVKDGPWTLPSDSAYSDTSWQVTQGTGEEICQDCYSTADIYVLAKAGKKTYALKYQDVELRKWSVFGKKYAAYAEVANDNVTKYSYKLETEMALAAEDLAGEEIMTDGASLYMVGFGSATLAQKAGNSGTGICVSGTCIPVTTAAIKLNGWFVGWYSGEMPDEAIWTCDSCGGYLYGGTWAGTYDTKLSESFSGDADAESYIGADLDDIIE